MTKPTLSREQVQSLLDNKDANVVSHEDEVDAYILGELCRMALGYWECRETLAQIADTKHPLDSGTCRSIALARLDELEGKKK